MQVDQHTGMLRPAIGSLLCCRCWACSFTPGLNIVFCLLHLQQSTVRFECNLSACHHIHYSIHEVAWS